MYDFNWGPRLRNKLNIEARRKATHLTGLKMTPRERRTLGMLFVVCTHMYVRMYVLLTVFLGKLFLRTAVAINVSRHYSTEPGEGVTLWQQPSRNRLTVLFCCSSLPHLTRGTGLFFTNYQEKHNLQMTLFTEAKADFAHFSHKMDFMLTR